MLKVSAAFSSSALLAFALAGCGGGAGGHASFVPPGGGSQVATPPAKTTVTFTIVVPKQSASTIAHRPAYVSPATQSMTVNVTGTGGTANPAGFPMTVGLTPTSSGCTSSLASTTCTLQLSLAAGSYAASISTFDGTNGTGNALSTAQAVAFTVVADTNNTIPLTLSGIPTAIYVASAGTNKIYVVAQDADGNFIVGAGAPTFTAAKTAGTAVAAITQPTASAPNLVTFALASPAPTPGTETIGVTASFPSGTNACAQTGAVCTLASAVTANYTSGTAFLANYNNSNLLGYSLPLTGASQSPAYNVGGINYYPYGGIGADANGDVFVAAYDTPGTLVEVSPPYSAVTASNTVPGDQTYGSIAAAPNGDVFVPSYGGTLQMYAPPYTGTPTSITTDISSPYGAASDANSVIYVANSGNTTVSAYSSPYTGTPVVVSTSSAPYAVFVSGSKLFVGETSYVDVFTLPLTNGELPAAKLTVSNVEYGLATDASGNLWAGCYDGCADSTEGELYEFTTPFSTAETPAVKLPMPASGFSSYDITGVGVDKAGNVYVENGYGGADEGGLLEYTPPITSSSTPAVGVETGAMYYPWGMVLTGPQFTVTL